MKLKFLFISTLLMLIGITFSNGYAKSQSEEAVSTTEKTTEATQVYGPQDAEIALLIGNGGAGPTCLLQALSEDFIQANKLHIRIGWVQTISRLTLENLKNKVIDVSLTYEAEPEWQAIQEGWASQRRLVFNDHFILVGPKSNPAGILPSDTPEEAFQKIAKKGKLLSRNDLSGSNQRERAIWQALHLQPWDKDFAWYIKAQVFPADAIKKADQEGLYTLTDRGTLLTVHQELSHTAVYIQHGDQLLNRCHAMLQNQPSTYAQQFLDYLSSPRAQDLIATYAGKDKQMCCPFFTPAAQDHFLDKACLESLGLAYRPN